MKNYNIKRIQKIAKLRNKNKNNNVNKHINVY